MEPEGHKFGADLRRLGQLLIGKAVFQFLFCRLQFFKALFRGFGQNTLLDRVYQVANLGIRFLQLPFIQGNVGIVLFLQLHEHRNDSFDCIVIHNHLHGFGNNQILNPAFFNRLFVAFLALLLDRNALVIVVDNPGAAGAAFATEVGPIIPTEQLGCQQIIVLSLMPGRGFFIFLHFGLYPVKKVLRHNGRYAIRNENIPVLIFANVAAVFQ